MTQAEINIAPCHLTNKRKEMFAFNTEWCCRRHLSEKRLPFDKHHCQNVSTSHAVAFTCIDVIVVISDKKFVDLEKTFEELGRRMNHHEFAQHGVKDKWFLSSMLKSRVPRDGRFSRNRDTGEFLQHPEGCWSDLMRSFLYSSEISSNDQMILLRDTSALNFDEKSHSIWIETSPSSPKSGGLIEMMVIYLKRVVRNMMQWAQRKMTHSLSKLDDFEE